MINRKSRRELEWELEEVKLKLEKTEEMLKEAQSELDCIRNQKLEGCNAGSWCYSCKHGAVEISFSHGSIYRCAISRCEKFEPKEANSK